MPAPLPEHTREAIADAVRAGGTCRGVAREFTVSPSTVRKVAAEYGITDAFSRAQTEQATKAKTADLAARRAALAEGLLDDVAKLRERAWSEHRYHMATRDDIVDLTLPVPPLPDVAKAYQAIGVCTNQHLALVKHDTATDGGTSAVEQWLAYMMTGGPTQSDD